MKKILHKFNLVTVLFILLGLFSSRNVLAQTKGLIYKPAGNALGKSVLDPNNDGFSSTTISGFSVTDYGTASELQMIPLPVLIDEPLGDLTTGSSGGHTDIVTNSTGSRQSCYLLIKNVGGIDYLIVRFRLGGNSTSPKAYSLLLDIDGSITNNYTASNPGFEREVVLSATNSVSIFSHNAAGATLLQSYNVDNYQQRSVALSMVGGNADYFYDFFVPLSAVNASTAVRMVAVTVNSLSSGLSGTFSDVNGINDTNYGGNLTSIFQAVITASPAVPLGSLTTGNSFPNLITSAPVITSVLTTASTTVAGTSQEANGTTITVFRNGVSIGTTTVTSNAWTLTGVSGLTVGNLITARALAAGKDPSAVSNTVEVSTVQSCFTPAPVNLTRVTGQIITGNYAHANGGTIAANTVRIRLYEQVNATTFTEINAASTVFVATNGTWSFPTGLGQSVFNTTTILATATFNSCASGYSAISKKTSGQVGTTTATPTMVTTQIIASPTVARSVQVTNNDTTPSNLILYINGFQIAISPTTIATGASFTFSYTGFIEGDIVTARAQSATVDYWLSNPTAAVIVIASATPSAAPVITGTYTSGSGKTVTGTSIEISGTTITLYTAGTVLIGTTTVNSFGNWSIAGLTLATNDVLTAFAKATTKTLSAVSNSVTVAASVPSGPVVASPITAGQTSISGTGGLGTITVFVDGSSIGTTTGASWTLSGINPLFIYRGGIVSATNTVSNVSSLSSNQVIIQGVVSFCITDTSGNPITTKISEDPFLIRITAMTGANCTGGVFTGFTGTVTISSSNTIVSGGGVTASFVNGVLTTTISIGGSGNGVTINVVNTNDPTATGTTSLNVTAVNSVLTSDQTICAGTAPVNLNLTTNLSTIVKWQKSSDTLFTSAIDIANTTTTLTGASIGNLTSTTYFRVVLTTGSGSTVFSNFVTISVTPVSVGGAISGSATVCAGTNSTILTLSGHTGSITKWQSSTISDFSSGVIDIANTTVNLTASNLTTTLFYRAVVTNGVCNSANSLFATVTVNQAPTAVAGGSQTICQTGTAVVSGASSTNGTRLWTHNGTGTLTNATTLTPTYTAAAGDAGTTVTLTMTVTNSPCAPATATYVINVNVNSEGGTVTGGGATCSGVSSGLLILSGYNGIVLRWEYSISPFTNWITIANTSATYTSPALTQTTQFRAVVQSGTCSEANSSPATVLIEHTTWNGSSWTNGMPTSASSVLFTGNYTATTDINACTITVSNNAVVQIPSNFDVTLNGALIVSSGSFTLNNSSNLIQNGTDFTNSGAIIVKRNSSALKRLDYTLWSSPVTGQGLYAFSPFTLPNRFYVYTTSTDLYSSSVGFNLSGLQYPAPLVAPNGVNGTDNNNVQFASAKGYLIRTSWNHPTTATVWNGTFTGVPNNGNTTFAMSTGYNAVGNPYPSRINVHDFIDGNTTISGPLYFWRKTNDNLATSYATLTKIAYVANGAIGGDTGTGYFNTGNEANWVINIGQGFLVNATSNTNLNFTNSMRRSLNSDQFFRSPQISSVNNGLYWLNLTTSLGTYSQMAVGYSADGTLEDDRGIDGKNINNEFYLTSLIGPSEYSVQGRPDFEDNDIVPLSYKVTTAGTYTISIDHLFGLFSQGSQSIFLKDNLTTSITNLNAGVYTFASAAGTFNNRFEIVYQSTLGNPNFTATTVVIYNQNGGFVVNSGNITMASIKVFDIRGRLLEEKKDINASQISINGGLANGVLLVQITSADGETVTKKVLK